jgi:hypothetical protein
MKAMPHHVLNSALCPIPFTSQASLSYISMYLAMCNPSVFIMQIQFETWFITLNAQLLFVTCDMLNEINLIVNVCKQKL